MSTTEQAGTEQTEATPKGWGLFPLPDVVYHWSARAILCDGGVDLVWDRMGVEGPCTDDERKALSPRLKRSP